MRCNTRLFEQQSSFTKTQFVIGRLQRHRWLVRSVVSEPLFVLGFDVSGGVLVFDVHDWDIFHGKVLATV
jgi:hypothetical protein